MKKSDIPFVCLVIMAGCMVTGIFYRPAFKIMMVFAVIIVLYYIVKNFKEAFKIPKS